MKSNEMVDEVEGLKPGKVAERHFELLIDGTGIRGEKITEALRDYLVNGVPLVDAWKNQGLNPGQFYTRLKVVQAESARAQELSAFYPKQRAKTKPTVEGEADVEPVAIEATPTPAPKAKAKAAPKAKAASKEKPAPKAAGAATGKKKTAKVNS
jgi:hypothetical protein